MTIPLKIISKKEYLKKNKEPNQEEVWDVISDLWNDYRKQPFDAVISFLKNKKGRVIDLGCGSGRNMIKNDSLEYFGVDISANQLTAADVFCKRKRYLR